MAKPAETATVLARVAGMIDLGGHIGMPATRMCTASVLRTVRIVIPRNRDQEQQTAREQCCAQAKGPGAANGHNSSGYQHGRNLPERFGARNQAKPDNDVGISPTPPT